MTKLLGFIRERWESIKLYVVIAIATVLLGVIAAITNADNEEVSTIIKRNEPGQGSSTKEYLVSVEGLMEEEPFDVTVDSRVLSEKEIEELFVQAAKELDQVILGENETLDYIDSPLNMVTTLQQGLVRVDYSISDHKIMTSQGEILEDELSEDGNLIEIKARLKYLKNTSEHIFYARIYPPPKSENQSFLDGLRKLISAQNDNEGKLFILPGEYEGKQIIWSIDKKTNKALTVFLIGIVAMGLVAVARKNDERRAKQKAENELREDYPRVVNQLSLLLSAGMTVSGAWEKMVKNYQIRKVKRIGKKSKICRVEPGFEEMEKTYRQIKDGVSEVDAYQQFGERIGISEYRKLSTLLVQNLRKGAVGLSGILERECLEAYAKQESIIKKKGEELSTKMLAPMMIMLGLVIVVIVIPAIFKFRV